MRSQIHKNNMKIISKIFGLVALAASIILPLGCGSQLSTDSKLVNNPNPEGPAWFEEKWEYADTLEMKSNPNGWLSFKTYNAAKAQTYLDTSLSATPWGGSKGLRTQFYAHPEREPEAHTDLNFPLANSIKPRALWIEFYAMFEANWTTWPPANGSGGTDFKWVMFLLNRGRWGMRVGMFGGATSAGSNWAISYGNQSGSAPRVAQVQLPAHEGPFVFGEHRYGIRPDLNTWLFNGQWYRYRFHLKLSDEGMRNGAYLAWRDNEQIINVPAFDTGNLSSDYFAKISLGRNLSQGTTNVQAVRFGPVQAWVNNPVW